MPLKRQHFFDFKRFVDVSRYVEIPGSELVHPKTPLMLMCLLIKFEPV